MIIIDAFIAYLGALPVAIHVVHLPARFACVRARLRPSVNVNQQPVSQRERKRILNTLKVCAAATDEKQQQEKKQQNIKWFALVLVDDRTIRCLLRRKWEAESKKSAERSENTDEK